MVCIGAFVKSNLPPYLNGSQNIAFSFVRSNKAREKDSGEQGFVVKIFIVI